MREKVSLLALDVYKIKKGSPIMTFIDGNKGVDGLVSDNKRHT